MDSSFVIDCSCLADIVHIEVIMVHVFLELEATISR